MDLCAALILLRHINSQSGFEDQIGSEPENVIPEIALSYLKSRNLVQTRGNSLLRVLSLKRYMRLKNGAYVCLSPLGQLLLEKTNFDSSVIGPIDLDLLLPALERLDNKFLQQVTKAVQCTNERLSPDTFEMALKLQDEIKFNLTKMQWTNCWWSFESALPTVWRMDKEYDGLQTHFLTEREDAFDGEPNVFPVAGGTEELGTRPWTEDELQQFEWARSMVYSYSHGIGGEEPGPYCTITESRVLYMKLSVE